MAVPSCLVVDVVPSVQADGSGASPPSPQAVPDISVSSLVRRGGASRHRELPHHLADYMLD